MPGLVQVGYHNPRDYADNKHNNVDDKPYGGGPGMVMQVAPLRGAIKAAKQKLPTAPVIYLSPQGKPLTQAMAAELSATTRNGFISWTLRRYRPARH